MILIHNINGHSDNDEKNLNSINIYIFIDKYRSFENILFKF